MFFVNLSTCQLVNSVGSPAGAPVPRFVNAQKQTFTFKFFNACGPVGADFFSGFFHFTGSTEFSSASPCFRASGVVDAEAGTISFDVDTYTEQYLSEVSRPGTVMYCDITRQLPGDTLDTRIALITCTADPRVYVPGLPPAPLAKYYTAAEVNSLLAAKVNQTDSMPAASAELAGQVYVYTGETTAEYTQKSFYLCTLSGNQYVWSAFPADPQGEPGPQGATTPMVDHVYFSDTYGTACYLDDDNAVDVIGYQAEAWKSLDLYIVSADSSVTGNIVLVLGENRLVAPVSAVLTKLTWDLAVPTAGLISIVRDTSDAEDTLKDSDGNVVT